MPLPSALDPAWTSKTQFSIHTGGGGVCFGSPNMVVTRAETPRDFESPIPLGGGTSGKTVGGVAKGWVPTPAIGAAGYISPRSSPLKGLPSYYVATGTVASMSYTTPTLPTTPPRRMKADGIKGEFELQFPLQRSIGGHESGPSESPRSSWR